jgi:transposase-like protein
VGLIGLKSVKELFSGRHFDQRVSFCACAGICAINSASATWVKMMVERGLQLAHTTVIGWVQRCVPEFEKRSTRYMRQSGRLWRADETRLKVRGRWVYLYRAVDRDGNTVDFRLSTKRDVAAAKAFFRKALRTQERAPISITLDGYAGSHRAVREMPAENKARKHSKLRSSKYLSNLIEQDHRVIKFRTKPCSASRTMIARPRRSPASNCSAASARTNSRIVVCASKTRLRLRPAMQCSPREPRAGYFPVQTLNRILRAGHGGTASSSL